MMGSTLSLNLRTLARKKLLLRKCACGCKPVAAAKAAEILCPYPIHLDINNLQAIRRLNPIRFIHSFQIACEWLASRSRIRRRIPALLLTPGLKTADSHIGTRAKKYFFFSLDTIAKPNS
jgi:hypothetical protein